MRRFHLLAALGCLTMLILATSMAWAEDGGLAARCAYKHAPCSPWHGYYYDPAWGMPIALVVPPTAETQTHYGWGVGNTRVTTIYHQFHRDYGGPGVYNRRNFLPTPPWPSDTDQFGVYYIRGPW
jgi:hypothetical protein